MNVITQEYQVGLETFYTTNPGIGGKLRVDPEDFIVNEEFKKPPKDTEGIYTIATVYAKNWETNKLIREISKQLHISRKRIHFAGTKDKRSMSTQLLSFYNISCDTIKNITIKDVEFSDVYTSNKKLHIGDLIGNNFIINIKNIPKKVTEETMEELLKPIIKIQGFPNYFGIQRFGIIRPITHKIGRYLIEGNFEKAVMTYLTELDENEDKESYEARLELQKTNDYKEAFKHYPNHLIYEKSLLNYLQKNPAKYVEALKELPTNLLTMFVYAYQSYLFNKILSQRIKKDLPFHKAIKGDVILEIKNNNPTNAEYKVTSRNIEKINKQIIKRKAVVSSILFGSDTNYSEDTMGGIEQEVIEKEDIDKRNFIIPELPIASSYGKRRPIFCPLQNFNYHLRENDTDKQTQIVKMQFSLPKGSYATSFLREIMKAEYIRDY